MMKKIYYTLLVFVGLTLLAACDKEETLEPSGANDNFFRVSDDRQDAEAVLCRDFLEKNGILQRVHGGAVAVGKMAPFKDLLHRVVENDEQKAELSEIAAELIQEKDIIGIDAGSTAIYFAKAIKEKFSELTVITHSLDVFEILCRHKNFKVILCGGNFLQNENSFYGPLAIEMLNILHMQKAFLFPSSISLQNGIYDNQHELYQIQYEFMKHAEKIYFLADSSKFERNAMLRLDETSPNYIYVTDSRLPKEIKSLYKKNKITIITGKEDINENIIDIS